MGLVRRILLTATLLMAAAIASNAQLTKVDTVMSRYGIYSSMLAQEKVYLHLDRTVYCPGETIWLCGYTMNASRNDARAGSNYMYVELFRPDDTRERRIKLKRDGLGFPGNIFLRDDIEPGEYTVRAYTLSQLDFPAEQMFHQRITISGNRHRTAKESTKIDVTFYPEGGRYFVGTDARVGFKAMDSNGKSVTLSGRLVDQDGEEVAKGTVRHDGMGDLRFIPAEGKTYFFVTADGGRFPLPAPAKEGATIGVLGLSGRSLVTVTGVGNDRYTLLLRDISDLQKIADVQLGANPTRLILPDELIDGGINQLILVDSKGQKVSERLFFKYAPVPECKVKSAGVSGARSQVAAEVSLSSPDGKPLDGSFSVSVTRGSLAACVQDDGIDSYTFLSSELRGAINDPRYYFNPEISQKERTVAMDLLMLIQGWTYYDMETIGNPAASLGKGMSHAREYWQSIKGTVSRSLSSKVPKNFTMTVMMPSMGSSTIVKVDEGKNFVLDSLDFEEGTGMMIKITRLEKGFDYVPEWSGEEFASELKYKPAPGIAYANKSQVDVEYHDPSDTLKAAVLVSTRPEYSLGINGRQLPRNDYKIYGHMTLINYLQMETPFMFDGQFMSTRRTTLLQSRPDNWDESPVKLLVDGMEAPWDAFASLTMDEIESISVSTEPDMVIRALDGVVSIKLEYGTRVTRRSDSEPSLLYFTPLGWQKPSEFYSPRYDLWPSQDPDHRNTIFWDPAVKLVNGKAKVKFFSSDDEDYPYTMHVEGLSAQGQPFSLSFEIQNAADSH